MLNPYSVRTQPHILAPVAFSTEGAPQNATIDPLLLRDQALLQQMHFILQELKRLHHKLLL